MFAALATAWLALSTEPFMERSYAPYMEWATSRPAARFDLAISNMLGCSLDDLPGARDALSLGGRNDNGYPPLLEAIAVRYGVRPDQVTTAQGASGANFLVCAALLGAGDDVLVERPGFDPLLGAPRLLGANTIRFERSFAAGFALEPSRIRAALTPRTKLIVVTSPHNPSGVIAEARALDEIGALAAAQGAHVLVDEVYLDVANARISPAACRSEVFISTSSLTKSYGLAALRCGWILASAGLAERLRRTRGLVDGSGSIVAERLSVLAFRHLERLIARARRILAENFPKVVAFMDSRPELEWVEPHGGTVCFPRVRGVPDTSTLAARLLAERDTAVVPGRFFEAPGHFRLGFSGRPDTLERGLRHIGAALDARSW